MRISKAVQYALDYHKANSGENTVRSCEFVLSRFEREFEGKDLDAITSDDVLAFLTHYTEGAKQSTKRSRYATATCIDNDQALATMHRWRTGIVPHGLLTLLDFLGKGRFLLTPILPHVYNSLKFT